MVGLVYLLQKRLPSFGHAVIIRVMQQYGLIRLRAVGKLKAARFSAEQVHGRQEPRKAVV